MNEQLRSVERAFLDFSYLHQTNYLYVIIFILLLP